MSLRKFRVFINNIEKNPKIYFILVRRNSELICSSQVDIINTFKIQLNSYINK